MRVARHTSLSLLRPRYEGANIGTWIGFKHLMYLAEEGLLDSFREQGWGPGRLFHEYGLSLAITDASLQLPALLEIDDEVQVETQALEPGRFATRLRVIGAPSARVVANGKLSAALVAHAQASPGALPVELAALAPCLTLDAGSEVRDIPLPDDAPDAVARAFDAHVFQWSWQARYFHCHGSEHVQHSAYVRALEELVARFLEARGLAVGQVLAERQLIPVVSRFRVRVLRPVSMEETLHCTFVVDDVLMDKAYDGRMDCYVRRAGVLRHVASARILHGYAHSAGPEAGRLASLDAETLRALTRGTSC